MPEVLQIDWPSIMRDEVQRIEKNLRLHVLIDDAIVLEVGRLVTDNIAGMGIYQPNVAKIAGQVAFWIRKLKPLSVAPDSPNHYLALNERAALNIGIAICNMYKDDFSKLHTELPSRIFLDWLKSFRYNSHSPHSSMVSFELLMCDR